jgi:hypothetical protein
MTMALCRTADHGVLCSSTKPPAKPYAAVSGGRKTLCLAKEVMCQVPRLLVCFHMTLYC